MTGMLPELTPVFSRLSTITDFTDLSTDDLTLLERFFVILYSPTCNADDRQEGMQKVLQRPVQM